LKLEKMAGILRTRDLNVPKNQEKAVLKSSTSKHKGSSDDEKDGPSRPKRVALSGITETLNSTMIDSSKKQLAVNMPKSEVGRILPLIEPEAVPIEVDSPNKQEDIEVDPSKEALIDPMPDFDFDKESSIDPFSFSTFASDIFKYFKFRERAFRVENYYSKQRKFDQKARAMAVNWLVQVQESFELNHETLYMAVKIMDLYVSKIPSHTIMKSRVQLVPCVALMLASKMEERCAPSVDDLVYLLEHVYTAGQMKELERDMLRVVGFDLGFPLSYSFLRRYARVMNVNLGLLTTARFYLELSLHYLKFCMESESKMAAACMLLALRVTKSGDWNPILEKYSGYQLKDIEQLMLEINHAVIRFNSDFRTLKSVSEKYSHPVFHEVALKPVLFDRIIGPVE
jgi:hypothetical protein